MFKKIVANILTICMIAILANPTTVEAKPNDNPLFVSVRASQPSLNESSEGNFPEIMPFRGIYSILKPQSLASNEYIHYSAGILKTVRTPFSEYKLELKAPGESGYSTIDESDNNADSQPKSEIFYESKFSGDSPIGDYDFKVTIDELQTTFKIVLSGGYTIATPTIINGTDSKPVNGMKFSKVELVTDGIGQKDIAPNEKLASYTYVAVQFEITGVAIADGEFIPTLTSNTAISMWGKQPFKNYDSVKVKKGDTLLNRALYQDGLGLGGFGMPLENVSDLKLELIFKPTVPVAATSSAPVSSSSTNSSNDSSQKSTSTLTSTASSDAIIKAKNDTTSSDVSKNPVVSTETVSELSKNSDETAEPSAQATSNQTATTEKSINIPVLAIVVAVIILVVLAGVLIIFRKKLFKKK